MGCLDTPATLGALLLLHTAALCKLRPSVASISNISQVLKPIIILEVSKSQQIECTAGSMAPIMAALKVAPTSNFSFQTWILPPLHAVTKPRSSSLPTTKDA